MGGRDSTTLQQGRVQTKFYAEDESANVFIDSTGAAFNFEKQSVRIRSPTDVPESLRQFLDKHPEFEVDERWWARTTRDFVERRLDPDEQVHVYGPVLYDPR